MGLIVILLFICVLTLWLVLIQSNLLPPINLMNSPSVYVAKKLAFQLEAGELIKRYSTVSGQNDIDKT